MTASQEFIDYFSANMKACGLDAITSDLFTITYLEPSEISIEELSKRSGYSLASISNKMRFLESFNLVERIKKPGSKKVFYFMEKKMVNLRKKKIQNILQKEIGPGKTVLPKIIDKYKNSKMSNEEKQKMKIINDYYKELIAIEDVFKDALAKLEKI